MQEQVLATIARHRLFAPGDRVGVAVSGGADSVCLLHLLHALAPQLDLSLAVLHLNHNLRGEASDGDAEFVAALARDLSLPFHIESAGLAAEGGNLEQAARNARRAFFLRLAAGGTVTRVATGHTRNDQAETVLFRFLRGSGTAGLAAIRPVAGHIVRPLLDVTRAEVEAWLRERALSWREDASNQDPRFARNRLRHALLPQLMQEWNPAIVDVLGATADWAQAEESYWQAEIERLAALHLERGAGGALLVRAATMRELPLAAARRLLRYAIAEVKGDLLGIDFAHVAQLLALATHPSGHGHFQAAGCAATRSFDWLRLSPHPAEECTIRDYSVTLAAPGITPIPGINVVIRAEIIEKSKSKLPGDYVYNGGVGYLDWGRMSGRLEVRNWRPGDHYQPIGHTTGRKLKQLFQTNRIPLWERRHWPVVTSGSEIVWSPRFGSAATVTADQATCYILRVEEQPGIGVSPRGV